MKFSVLLPTRNRLELLSRAIETVCRQNYDDWEIIVSDNLSEEDVASYIQSLGDTRIKYFRTDRFVPVTDNWNNAIDRCDGDYIIMLGDDDCIMQGYFSTLSKLIDEYREPDLIYTGAYLYAYPGVLPGAPGGFLKVYSNRKIYQSAGNPFWLDKETAIAFVRDSLDFRVTFDYNMQFSLVSRKMVQQLKQYGTFYQSPYPDYYASNALLLKADRILVVPQPLVTIGISPKSFGYYFFNDAEDSGNEFLNNLPDQAIVNRVQGAILPGPVMNTSWLIAMETLSTNFGHETEIKVNYARYRLVQIYAVFAGAILGKKGAGTVLRQLIRKMTLAEWVRYGWLLAPVFITPTRYRRLVVHRIAAASGSHPGSPMPDIPGSFKTIIDVFEQVVPESHVP